INVSLRKRDFPAELRVKAGSLRMAGGADVSRAELLTALLLELEQDYTQWARNGLLSFIPALRARDALRGREVIVERAAGALRGCADGVELDGSLRLRLANGYVEHVYSGDAHLRNGSASGKGRRGSGGQGTAKSVRKI
ncbi:MAG: hypothetical protein PHR35_10105, partial [Kiritimatiellae bacterium]|nr:hypothetical protein [Kiritimatiellia bacterium]